jgi:uncharacterized protein YjdB
MIMPNPNFDVLAHIEDMGDIHAGPGEYAGTRGKTKFMEGFSVTFTGPVDGIGLRYRAHITDSGDTQWVKDGTFVGARGKRKSVEGFAIELSGANLAQYDVLYMTHIRDVGDTGWVSNGAFCGTQGQRRPVEGLAVKVVPRTHNYVSLISKAASGSGKALLITASAKPGETGVFVSAANGSDLQLWDRRPVKGGQGFALINKGRPTLCIARGPGQPTVLKEVKLIDTDDTCVWRDDTVPGIYNAINSWTNWELKFDMSGNPPYADNNNVLISYPWAGGAPNELWRQNKATYNLVAGTDDRALNTLSEAIYRGCYPKVFKGSLPIGKGGIKSVGYDVVSVPVFNLKAATQLQEHFQQQLLQRLGASDERSREIAIEAAASMVDVRIDVIKLIVETDKPVSTNASLQMGASIQANPDRSLTLNLKLGELKIPDLPELERQLNEWFVPLLLELLNHTILDHIAIPAINLLGIEFTAPVIATRYPHVLAASSKIPDSTMLPPPSRWPDKKVFVGADETVLNSVGAAALDQLKPSGNWKYQIDIGICDLVLEAHYEMNFRNPRFTVTPTSGNTYKVAIELGGYAWFRAKCGIFSASPGARAYGRVNATAAVSVDKDNKVILTFKSLDNISLDWSFDGLPVWMDAVISTILGAFNPIVLLSVTAALSGKTFEVYTIPTIDATIAGTKFEIRLKDLVLDSAADAAQKPLLLVTGAAEVKIR